MNPDRPTTEEVWRMLEAVIDPELHSSVVDLGMVRDVAVDEDGLISVEIALTIASCPLRGQIESDVESRLRGLPGTTGVEIRTTAMTAPERANLMAKARKQAAERAPETEIPLTTRILAVASGKGGVGKSSVTVNLAAALAARGHTVGVLDADIWGFSVPRMLGINSRLGGAEGKIHPNEVKVPSVRPNGEPGTLKVVSMGFLVEDEGMALMWRGLVLAKAVEQFLTDVRWGDLDYLLVDMPPGTGDIQMALSRLLPRAELLVVTTPALAAQKVAVRVADMARCGREHERVHLRPRPVVPAVRIGRRAGPGRRGQGTAVGPDSARTRRGRRGRHRFPAGAGRAAERCRAGLSPARPPDRDRSDAAGGDVGLHGPGLRRRQRQPGRPRRQQGGRAFAGNRRTGVDSPRGPGGRIAGCPSGGA
jgi:Mrp family chromosome partitioning ATPase